MKFIALHIGHTATAAIMEDGKVLGVLSEEKINNIKNSSAFPHGAIKALYREHGWQEGAHIDQILISSAHVYSPSSFSSKSFLKKYFGRFSNNLIYKRLFSIKRHFQHQSGDHYLIAQLKKAGLSDFPITRIDHHTCHAAAAYYGFSEKPNQKALIFTMDGEGDGISSTVSVVDKNGFLRRIASTPYNHSIGWMYSATTRFLGMRILEHEYKVMGLAPYAKNYFLETYKKIFKDVVTLNPDNPLTFKSKLNMTDFYEYLAKSAVGERFDNIAAALQFATEELVTKWIKNAIKHTGIKNIYTGGGVFMNVKLNKKIQEIKEVDRITFMPSCGDESLPIGALYHYAKSQGIKTYPLNDLYLGISYADDAINKFLKKNQYSKKYKIKKQSNIDLALAKLLAKGDVVARFSGRCEWGARSLGNRAILAHPSFMESFYMVNDQIKSRDFWMPFAPSMLDRFANQYLQNYEPEKNEALYMITAFDATPKGVKNLKATIHHGDHSLRPQIVTKKSNLAYYQLISEFSRLTGVGALLNTSMNLHGYPLVCSPEQALFTFENSHLKHLALGSYLISKNQ